MQMPVWLQVLLIILSPFLAAMIGLFVYYRKREHEFVQRRYLEEGIDLIAANIENSLGLFLRNHEHSLYIIKQCRELSRHNLEIPEDLYADKFLKRDQSTIYLNPLNRINRLLGDRVFVDIMYLLFAFLDISFWFFEGEVRNFVKRVSQRGRDTFKPEAERYLVDKIHEYFRESSKYYDALEQLHFIAGLIEQEKRLSFKKIYNFKNRPAVKSCVNTLKNIFEDEAEEYRRIANELEGGD